MSDVSVFDKLVKELSREERLAFLEKIKMSFDTSEEPLSVVEEKEEVDLTEKYQEFGFLRKVVIFFTQLFSGKDYVELTEELLIRDFARNIERTYPGLFDSQSGQLLGTLYSEVDSLEKAVSMFRSPIEKSLYRSKREFFAFLGSLEMELVHEQLLVETDPYEREHDFMDKSDGEVRSELDESLDRILTEINDSDRERMYLHSQALYYLSELCFFPYDSLLNQFVTDQQTNKVVCSVQEIEDELKDLTDLLYSFSLPPSGRLLNALFLFQYQEDIGKEEFELDSTVDSQMRRADSTLSTIRQFNQSVPLLDILKYAKKNINFHPNRVSGGEDWFALYKQFWQNRMENLFKRFSMERKRMNIRETALELVGLEQLPKLEYYNSEYMGDVIRLRYETALSFLYAFVREQLSKELNTILKIILIDGEFYKDQNRQDFTDAYNGLMRIPDSIKQIEFALTPSGDTGKALEVAKHEIIPPPLKKKKMEHLLHEVEEQARDVINKATDDLELLQNVLGGILHGEGGGRFDTLSNLGYLGGRNNKATMDKINKALFKIKETQELLSELLKVESMR